MNAAAYAGGGALVVGSYVRVEVRLTIDNAAGILQVYVNGALVINFVGDTQNGGNATIRTIHFGAYAGALSNSTGAYQHDDMVINDTAGAVNNAWPGNTAIYGIVPTGAGNYAQLTRGGADSGANWSQVDEVPPTDATDYVYDTVVNNKDSYAMSNLGVSGNVQAITWWARAQQDIAGVANIARLLRIGGVDYQGADLALAVGWAYYSTVLEYSPATGTPFSDTEIDALEAGVVVR